MSNIYSPDICSPDPIPVQDNARPMSAALAVGLDRADANKAS